MSIEVGTGLGGLVDKFKGKVKDFKRKKAQKRQDRRTIAKEALASAAVKGPGRYSTEAFHKGYDAIDWGASGKKSGDEISGENSAANCGAPADPRPEDSAGGAPGRA